MSKKHVSKKQHIDTKFKGHTNDSKSTSCEVRYYVNGMHCAACETLIEKELKSWQGVKNVNAKLNSKEVTLTVDSSDDIPDISKLNNVFDELGYSFSKQREQESTLTKRDTAITVSLAIIFVLGFILISKGGSSILNFNINSESSLFGYFVFGLIAGFSSCAALVGGLLLSLSKKWNDVYGSNSKKSKTPFILFMTGRIVSFAILGGLLGLLGSVIKISPVFTSIMILTVSVIMFILGLQMIGIGWADKFSIRVPKKLGGFISDETNFKGKYMPFLVGFLTFFVPCGFTLIAQSNALLSGSFIISAYNMIAFALGTLPMLLLLSFTSIKLYGNPKISKQFSLFAGILVVFFAFYTMYSQFNIYRVTGSNILGGLTQNKNIDKKNLQNNAKSNEGSNLQVMKMTAQGFAYFPRQIYLKAGIPVRWEIDNKGADGCASVVYAPGLHSENVFLQPGVNIVNMPAPKPGIYKISCAMGMVDPVTVNVN